MAGPRSSTTCSNRHRPLDRIADRAVIEAPLDDLAEQRLVLISAISGHSKAHAQRSGRHVLRDPEDAAVVGLTVHRDAQPMKSDSALGGPHGDQGSDEEASHCPHHPAWRGGGRPATDAPRPVGPEGPAVALHADNQTVFDHGDRLGVAIARLVRMLGEIALGLPDRDCNFGSVHGCPFAGGAAGILHWLHGAYDTPTQRRAARPSPGLRGRSRSGSE